MKFAIVENGVVVNVAVADAPLGENWIASDVAGIDWMWDGVQFAHPPLPTPEVPQSVTMRQGRLALLGAGLLDDVDAALAAIPDATQRRAAQIEWEYAQTIDRQSAWVANLSGALGLKDEQLDALFVEAAKL